MLKNYFMPIILLASILFLVMIMIINFYFPNILKIESKWLVVAFSPTLIALMSQGYFNKLKFLGLEIELTNKIISLHSKIDKVDLTELDCEDKDSEQYLKKLSSKEKEDIEILKLELKNNSSYDDGTMVKYFEELINLKYLLILKNGKFICLLDAMYFKGSEKSLFKSFCASLNNMTVKQKFSSNILKPILSENEELISALNKINIENSNFGIIISNKKIFIGLIEKEVIEQKILNSLLNRFV